MPRNDRSHVRHRRLANFRVAFADERRTIFPALLVLAALWPAAADAAPAKSLTLDVVKAAPARALTVDGGIAAEEIKLDREWTGSLCRTRIVNNGKVAVGIKEIVLFDIPHTYPPQTHLFGEGFTMLSQTAGTLAKPLDLGLTDRNHYKIPQPADATVVYGLLTLWPPKGEHAVLAFTSCRRFIGRFYVRAKSIQVVVDAEGLALEPGQSWELEEFMFAAGADLIETMRFTPEEGIALLEFHLERIKASAAELGFSFDRHAVRNAIQALCFEADAPSRVRLVASRGGAFSLELGRLPTPLLSSKSRSRRAKSGPKWPRILVRTVCGASRTTSRSNEASENTNCSPTGLRLEYVYPIF